MIPTTATDAEFETYVANIIAQWNRARADQISLGRNWYLVAHTLAKAVGHGDARKGAGIIAALSANKRWAENRKLALDASAGNVHGHVGNALRKVQAILDGTDPTDVLPMAMKTGNFFRNIADPSDPDPVTIDRHAHDIAVGVIYGDDERGLSSKNRYALLAHAYREAARRLGEIAPVVQAATWTVQVDDLANLGTRGQRAA